MTTSMWDGFEVIDPKPGRERWEPNDESLRIVEHAQDVIASVPYRCTLRFVFYRLWQAGAIPLEPYDGGEYPAPSDKVRAYRKANKVLAKARHAGLIGRRALADDTRRPGRPGTFRTAQDWHKAVAQVKCRLDPWVGQEWRPRVLFEAEAMLAQFEHWTQDYAVELWPFRGDCSIDFRAALAEQIDADPERTALLYFGDFDTKGLSIAEGAGSVLHWADSDNALAFRVGLTLEQVQRYGLPDNPDKPGTYQWEALSDEQAGEVITGALDRFPRNDVSRKERKATALSAKALAGLLKGGRDA